MRCRRLAPKGHARTRVDWQRGIGGCVVEVENIDALVGEQTAMPVVALRHGLPAASLGGLGGDFAPGVQRRLGEDEVDVPADAAG